MNPIALFAALLFTLTSFAACAEDTWLQLEKAAHAAHELSYDGIYVFHLGQQAKSVQITHVNLCIGLSLSLSLVSFILSLSLIYLCIYH